MYLLFEDGTKMEIAVGQTLAGIKRLGSRPYGFELETPEEGTILDAFYSTWKSQVLMPALAR